MDRMTDGETLVVHLVRDCVYQVDLGHGNVEHESADVSLCERWVGKGWVEWKADKPVTCFACLHEAQKLASG